MTFSTDGLKSILNKILNGKGDGETVEYMAEMLAEETFTKLDLETLDGLIGPFLVDMGVDSMTICKKLLEAIQCKIDVPQCSTKKADQNLIKKPFDANSFLEGAQAVDTVVSDFVVSPNRLLVVRVVSKDLCFLGYIDPYLGLEKVNVNFNAQVPIAESLKMESLLQKEREKQLRRMREWEKTKAPLPSPTKLHGDKERAKMTDIIVNTFTVSVAGRELLKDATLKIVIGRKYGLIGRNGIGKSTFISQLVRHEVPGVGQDITIGCVEQEIHEDDLDRKAIDAVLEVDTERKNLLEEEAELLAKPQVQTMKKCVVVVVLDWDCVWSLGNNSEEVGKRLTFVYNRLEEIDSSAAEAEAASILAGLGFSIEMQQKKIRQLSGGWRMRVALARALFSTPDILCLDEPTNHLDLHAVAWVTEHLQNFKTTCIIVSHARNFLNDVCSDIIDFKDQKLKYYRGDYDTFERVKAEAERLQKRQFEAQEMEREHVQKFIDRFRAKAATAKMVQSRIKALERLPNLEAVKEDPSLTFSFSKPEDLPTPILQMQGCWFTYNEKLPSADSEDWILKDVDLDIDLNSRIAICGVNGSGKSTLLKILSGEHETTKGFCRRHNKLRIGLFNQYHVEQLDLTLNSVQQILVKFPEANLKEEQARAYLSRFGINGLLALEPLYVLSGGQKSRVAIALMAFTNPHILILDEPTNHLDLDAVQALIAALNDFEGGVVVVSHDTHLLTCVADHIFHVDPTSHRVILYKGDIDQYRIDLLKRKI